VCMCGLGGGVSLLLVGMSLKVRVAMLGVKRSLDGRHEAEQMQATTKRERCACGAATKQHSPAAVWGVGHLWLLNQTCAAAAAVTASASAAVLKLMAAVDESIPVPERQLVRREPLGKGGEGDSRKGWGVRGGGAGWGVLGSSGARWEGMCGERVGTDRREGGLWGVRGMAGWCVWECSCQQGGGAYLK